MEVATGAMIPLLSKLRDLLVGEYNLEKRVKKGLASLLTEMELMYAVMRKLGEVPADQLDREVQIWVGKVRDLSYNMEDAVDFFIVHAVEEGHDNKPTNMKNRAKQLLKKSTKLFSKGKALHQISDAVQEATDLAKELAEQHNRYNEQHDRYKLEKHHSSADATIDPPLRAMYKDVAELIGVDHARDDLIKMLSDEDDEGSQCQLKIVSIVGFGGLGKTTLAKVVYDNVKVQYDCCAFVSVSRCPDMKKIFEKMLHQFGANIHRSALMDIQQVIDELRSFLQNKRFLLVIDDIWDERMWDLIRCAFGSNSLGCRVITTTRIFSVAEACYLSHNDMIYKMNPLSANDSRRLFFKRIFSSENGCPPELEEVSRDILKKCWGVPLYIITIASLLASGGQRIKSRSEWHGLLNSLGRGLTEHVLPSEQTRRILLLSYYDLPSDLKVCLLYLSIYPEDYTIQRDQLIWKWIAEGFVQGEKTETSLFELGETYFNELINRNLIQPIYDNMGEITTCHVHDMILDFILSFWGQDNFVTIVGDPCRHHSHPGSQIRRLSLQNSMVDQSTLGSMKTSHVRSIAIFSSAIILMPPLLSFSVLRVLDLSGCPLEKNSCQVNFRYVGNLCHLRYLGLAGTDICVLPAEIGNLQFLQVLDVRNNFGLKELPPGVFKLRRLICLHIDGYRMMRLAEDGLGNLTSLEVLEDIRATPNIVKELHYLLRLRVLKINLRNVSLELEEVFVESLCNLHNIQSLAIGGDCSFGSMDLLGERWVPPRRLRIFISHMLGSFTALPAWIKRNPSLLLDLSELSISVEEMQQDDLWILGRLPALRRLWIDSARQTSSRLLIGADGFKCVMAFTLFCQSSAQIVLEGGALPRAKTVEFDLGVRVAKDDGNGDFDLGLGNLLSLRKVFVRFFRRGVTVGEVKEAEAAVRQALDAHPNQPSVMIDIVPPMPAGDDDDDDDGICKEE